MRPIAVLVLLCAALPAVAAPMVPTPLATAGMADAPPAIDGVLDDACWAASAAILRGYVETAEGDWRLREEFVPVEGAVLTRPVRGPLGSFIRADLRYRDEVRGLFGKDDWEFYRAVETALSKARKDGRRR